MFSPNGGGSSAVSELTSREGYSSQGTVCNDTTEEVLKSRMSKRRKTGKDSSTTVKGNEQEDVNHSVLGGLKDPTLNSRVSGDEPEEIDGITHFKIPFNDKTIVCEKQGTAGDPKLIFTHGAGGGVANPATRDFCAGFATVDPVVAFQGTMNLQSRVKTFNATLDHEQGVSAIGGRSMGARAAVLTALDREEKPKALVLASWPLTTGKKGEKREPERREQILVDLPEGIDVLFIAGTKDVQCDLEQLEQLRAKMQAKSWLIQVEGADHGMSLKKKDGVKPVRVRTGALAAEWLRRRDDTNRLCAVSWDPDAEDVTCGGWTESGAGA